jgi:choline-sulfatase
MFHSKLNARIVGMFCSKVMTVLLFMAVSGVMPAVAQNQTQSRPDIIVLLLDDMRFDQFAAAGHPYIQTPTFDELAKNGAVLNRMYVTSPVCGPSRASLLTGRMPSSHGRVNNHVWPDQLGGTYLPILFRKAGYRTAIIGKDYEKASVDSHRNETWDRQFLMNGPAFPAEAKDFTPKQRKAYYDKHLYYDQNYQVDGKTRRVMGHQSDVLLDELKRFALASPDPYFAFVCPFAPHTPWNPSKGRLGKYEGKGVPPRTDLELQAMTPRLRAMAIEGHERMAEMIEDVDEALGRVVQALREAGRLDHTVIIITSDNGTMLGEKGMIWKQRPYEICARVPMIWFGPGSEQLTKAGVLDEPVSQADIFPTLAAMIDAPLPEDDSRYGQSLLQPRENVLVMQYPFDSKSKVKAPESLAWASLIGKRYKLTLRANDPAALEAYMGPPVELFDLQKDPYEQNNLAYSDPDAVLPSLQNALMEQLRTHGAVIQVGE